MQRADQSLHGLGNDPPVRNDVCTDFCKSDLTPADPFVAFSGSESTNVSEGPAVDIDGDGVADSRAAQAVACLAPQGIDGCGYEQPLETMLQALDPSAPWNSGARPFLREGSLLMIVLATDELDCSMDDPVLDPEYRDNARQQNAGTVERVVLERRHVVRGPGCRWRVLGLRHHRGSAAADIALHEMPARRSRGPRSAHARDPACRW